MESRESQKDRDYRYALARAMNGLQTSDAEVQRRAFQRLESDYGYSVASKAWREALRIKKDVDEAVDKERR